MNDPKQGSVMTYTGCVQCETPMQFGGLCEACQGYNDPSCLDSDEDFHQDE